MENWNVIVFFFLMIPKVARPCESDGAKRKLAIFNHDWEAGGKETAWKTEMSLEGTIFES